MGLQKTRRILIKNDSELRFKLTYMLDNLIIDLQNKSANGWGIILSKELKISPELDITDELTKFYKTYLEKVNIQDYFTQTLDDMSNPDDEDKDLIFEYSEPEVVEDDENNPYMV